MQQDPTHPTGVAETASHVQAETIAARERKADAAVHMYVEKDKTLKQICKKLGYPSEPAALAAIESRMAYMLANHPRSISAMRDMASRRLERLTRVTMRIAEDYDHPDQLQAVAQARGTVMDWAKLNGLQAPQQVVVTNPTDAAINAVAQQIINKGALPISSGDIFGDDADDSEILALEQRRRETSEADIVDAELVEDAEAKRIEQDLSDWDDTNPAKFEAARADRS